MSKIIRDFVNAGRCKPCGFFEGDRMAADFSRRMSRNQRKKGLCHGSIPSAFVDYLRESGIIYKNSAMQKGPLTQWQLLDLLWSNKKRNDVANYFYTEMIKEKYPTNSRSFDTAQYLWDRLQNGRVEVENFGGRW